MNKSIIFLFVFLILLVQAFAVPPDQRNEAGLFVSFPDYEWGKINTAFEIPVHVYTASDGLILSSGVNCTIHIYNSTGNHILTTYQDTPTHIYDYEIEINNSVFNSIGLYNFQIYCECATCGTGSTSLGGYIRHIFEITSDGAEKNNQGTSIFLILFIPLFMAFIFLFGGATLGEDHSVIKIFLYLLSVPMVWIANNWGVVALNRYYGLTELQELISSFTFWTAIVFSVVVTYFIIYSIWKMFNNIAQQKEDRLNY